MFLNIIVSIGRAVVIFHSYKLTGSTNTLQLLNWPLPWSARKRYGNYNKQIRLKNKLYTRNPIGDVTVTNISRETNYYHDSLQYPS